MFIVQSLLWTGPNNGLVLLSINWIKCLRYFIFTQQSSFILFEKYTLKGSMLLQWVEEKMGKEKWVKTTKVSQHSFTMKGQGEGMVAERGPGVEDIPCLAWF